MTHDFAKKNTKKKKKQPVKKSQVPGWLWGAVGVATGLFIALLVHLANIAPQAKQAAETEKTRSEKPVVSKKTESEAATAGKETKFEFYHLLKDQEVPVENRTVDQRKVQKYTYMLQAGSFRSFDDAEKVRVRLLLKDLNAKVTSSDDKNGRKWHRVMVGPFTSRSKMARARSMLIDDGIDTMLIKRKTS